MGKRANLVKANQTPLKQNLNVLFTDHDHHHHHYHRPSWYRTLCFRYIIRLVCVLTFSHFYHGRCIAAVLLHISVMQKNHKKNHSALRKLFICHFVLSAIVYLSVSIGFPQTLSNTRYKYVPVQVCAFFSCSLSPTVLSRHSMQKQCSEKIISFVYLFHRFSSISAYLLVGREGLYVYFCLGFLLVEKKFERKSQKQKIQCVSLLLSERTVGKSVNDNFVRGLRNERLVYSRGKNNREASSRKRRKWNRWSQDRCN